MKQFEFRKKLQAVKCDDLSNGLLKLHRLLQQFKRELEEAGPDVACDLTPLEIVVYALSVKAAALRWLELIAQAKATLINELASSSLEESNELATALQIGSFEAFFADRDHRETEVKP